MRASIARRTANSTSSTRSSADLNHAGVAALGRGAFARQWASTA